MNFKKIFIVIILNVCPEKTILTMLRQTLIKPVQSSTLPALYHARKFNFQLPHPTNFTTSNVLAREILGLPTTGRLSDQQIKNAFTQLSLQSHPDLGGNPEDFRIVTEARNILTDKATPDEKEQFLYEIRKKYGQEEKKEKQFKEDPTEYFKYLIKLGIIAISSTELTTLSIKKLFEDIADFKEKEQKLLNEIKYLETKYIHEQNLTTTNKLTLEYQIKQKQQDLRTLRNSKIGLLLRNQSPYAQERIDALADQYNLEKQKSALSKPITIQDLQDKFGETKGRFFVRKVLDPTTTLDTIETYKNSIQQDKNKKLSQIELETEYNQRKINRLLKIIQEEQEKGDEEKTYRTALQNEF